jgi:hypothetical protein
VQLRAGAFSRGTRAKKPQREALAHAGNRNSSNPFTERRESVEIRVPNAISHYFANFRAKQLQMLMY